VLKVRGARREGGKRLNARVAITDQLMGGEVSIGRAQRRQALGG